jgi:hypothetical protein
MLLLYKTKIRQLYEQEDLRFSSLEDVNQVNLENRRQFRQVCYGSLQEIYSMKIADTSRNHKDKEAADYNLDLAQKIVNLVSDKIYENYSRITLDQLLQEIRTIVDEKKLSIDFQYVTNTNI